MYTLAKLLRSLVNTFRNLLTRKRLNEQLLAIKREAKVHPLYIFLGITDKGKNIYYFSVLLKQCKIHLGQLTCLRADILVEYRVSDEFGKFFLLVSISP
jgi:hypothetical protein